MGAPPMLPYGGHEGQIRVDALMLRRNFKTYIFLYAVYTFYSCYASAHPPVFVPTVHRRGALILQLKGTWGWFSKAFAKDFWRRICIWKLCSKFILGNAKISSSSYLQHFYSMMLLWQRNTAISAIEKVKVKKIVSQALSCCTFETVLQQKYVHGHSNRG